MFDFLTKREPPKATLVRDIAVMSVFEPLDEYIDWACEQGIYLPPGYETDPTGWNEALRKMQRAFRMLHEEQMEEGELYKAKNEWKQFAEQDVDSIKALEKEIQEGLALFGKYLYFLTDAIVDRGPAH